MCDATTMAFGALQAYGQVQQGRAASLSADLNAMSMDAQATAERSNGQAEARVIRRAGRAQQGQTVAALAGAGVKVGEGSALEAERQVVADATRDEYMAILTGEQRAQSLEQSARSTRRSGRDARQAAYLTAGTSLLSAGAGAMRAGGWRANGPGFSGGQAPAPVESRVIIKKG